MSYDSWLTDYDGWLEKQPPIQYTIEYDEEEKVYMVMQDGLYYESFLTEDDAEEYINYLNGERV